MESQETASPPLPSPEDQAFPPPRPIFRQPWGMAAIGLAAAYLLTGLVAAPLLLPRLAAGSPLARLLEDWRATLRDGVLIVSALAATVPAVRALRAERLAAWLRPATAEALGAIRMWIAAILLASVVWEDLASSAFLPRGMLDLDRHLLIGTLHALPIGFDRMLASYFALRVFEVGTALLLGMAMAGLFTRWTVPAGALAYMLFAAILRSYAWSYHMGLIPLYALLLLSFTPCGEGWSLDRLRRQRRGEGVPPAREPRLRYGAGVFLVWLGIALPYSYAGLSKLRNTGFGWWRAEHMKQMLVGTVVEPMQFDFQLTFHLLRGPDWVFDVLGLAAIVGEVTFVLVLVSALARKVLPLVMAGMHVGILLAQNILFPDLIAIQAVFYDWTPVRRWLEARGMRIRAVAAGVRSPMAAPVPALAGGDAFASALPAMERDGAGAAGGGANLLARREMPDRATRRQAAVMRGFLVLVLLVWATRTEKFPLTAMQMFSRPDPLEPVEYVRPVAVYEDGSREPARFERWIGAVADSRYRRLLRGWDTHPERIALLHEFLEACALRANAHAAPGHRIRRFELELRRWDFRAHPDDDARGEPRYLLTHDVRLDAPPPS